MRLRQALCLTACLIASPALAQVRVTPNPGTLVNPASGPMLRALFGPGGYFMIAGGVVLGGQASFVADNGATQAPIDPAAVRPATMPDGVPALSYAGALYPIEMPPGLACPLARFTARDGIVAYTVPKFVGEDARMAMLRIGLRHHRVAREFADTVFEPLLHAADFAAAERLPPKLADQLSQAINTDNGIDGYVLQVAAGNEKVIGSLINSDAQVTYRVHLMPATHQVEIEGVPLRYYWQLDPSGAAAIFAVEELSQNWAPGTHPTNLAAPGAKPSQYDVIAFYQSSGLFRQLHQSHPAEFGAFTLDVCKEPAKPS